MHSMNCVLPISYSCWYSQICLRSFYTWLSSAASIFARFEYWCTQQWWLACLLAWWAHLWVAVPPGKEFPPEQKSFSSIVFIGYHHHEAGDQTTSFQLCHHIIQTLDLFLKVITILVNRISTSLCSGVLKSPYHLAGILVSLARTESSQDKIVSAWL